MNVKDIPSFPPGHSLPPTPEFNVPHITAASSSKADSPGRKPEPLPATQAAAISPTLWPSTADGTTPRARQSWASDHSSAKSAGWVNRVSERREDDEEEAEKRKKEDIG